MGMQAVLGDVEARNFDNWARGVDVAVTAAGNGLEDITVVDDADITVEQSHEVLEWSALTATRTATLPPLADTPEGRAFTFRDNTGLITSAIRINIVPDAADATAAAGIDGLLAYPITLARGFVTVIRGATRWNVAGQRLLNRTYTHSITNPDINGNASYEAVAQAGGQARVVLTLNGKTFVWTVFGTALYLTEAGSTTLYIFEKSVVMGNASLATSATDGFFYNQSWPGRPTGAPTSYPGRIPNGYDSVNYRHDAYIGGAWESLPMRCLNVQTASVGNVGTGEDDLHTYTLPANTLTRDGESVEMEHTISFAATAAVKQVRIYFGTQIVNNTSTAAAGLGTMVLRTRVYRLGASSQRASGTWANSSAPFPVASASTSTTAQDLTNSVVIKITGEATNNNDIVCTLSSVRFIPLGV
jgi:hypothetical protein